MIRVVLESPFGNNPDLYIPYGRACIADSLRLGEAPMAMHLLYTQPGVLDDRVPIERQHGLTAAQAWYNVAELCVVYRDFGISRGMAEGIALAESLGLAIHYRSLRGHHVSRHLNDPFPRRAVPLDLIRHIP